MTDLRNWRLSISESGILGILGYAQNHPRYPDDTRITYTSKFDELVVEDDRFVFSTKMVNYMVLFNDYAGVSEFQKSSVGGFGKTAESTVLWNINELKLSDKKESITYKNLKIAVLEKPKIPCDIILSASMFMKMRYTIDCSSSNHLLIVEADGAIYGVGKCHWSMRNEGGSFSSARGHGFNRGKDFYCADL